MSVYRKDIHAHLSEKQEKIILNCVTKNVNLSSYVSLLLFVALSVCFIGKEARQKELRHFETVQLKFKI